MLLSCAGPTRYQYHIMEEKIVRKRLSLSYLWDQSSRADTNSYNSWSKGLVLLIILLACLARRYPTEEQSQSSKTTSGSSDAARFPKTFQAVYIVSPHPFHEIDDFVITSSLQYQLDVTRYELGMKEGLATYLADRPNIRAIFVGTRRTDPHGEKLKHFDPTDSGWPDFVRVHPVIDWHYGTYDTCLCPL